jgi:predicted Zn-dependent protease
MVTIGWPELLIVFVAWLFLFGGWRAIRFVICQSHWFLAEMQGDSRGARLAEVRLGELLSESLTAEMPRDTDPLVGEIVKDIAQQLATALVGRRRAFRVQVVRSSQPNAFALPCDMVFVTSTMVEFCNRDELAFVLAHETAHSLCAHVHDRILGSLLLRLLTGMLTTGGWLGRLVRGYLQRALTSAYSQDQEVEADAEAIRLLRRAGFDPRAGDRLFARLEHIGGRVRQSGYFATHPPLAVRRARLQTLE